MKYKLKVVKLSTIVVGERFRVDLGNIEELAESIKERGLIQPICIDENNNLLAGGRRYAACTLLSLSDIPVLIKDTEGEVDAREIELMENIHRKEMTWQEQAKLTARIHSLYMEKDNTWNGRKTAELIDKNPMSISRALRLAASMEVLPDLQKCSTADEAAKVIKRAEETAIVNEIAKRQQARMEQATPADKGKNPILATLKKAKEDYIICDVFEGLEKLKKQHKKFHLIECDPPFAVPMPGTNKEFHQQSITDKLDTDAFFDISPKDYLAFLQRLSDGMWEVAEDNSWMLFWLAMDWYTEVVSTLEKTGWTVNTTPAIWIKNAVRTNPYPHNLSKGYHAFLVCKKGTPSLIRERRNNVFMYSNDLNPFHPHPRPLSLMSNILDTFVDSGAKVLVPFLGSGVTIRAAYKYGCECMGFDSSDKYKNHFLVAVEEDTKKLLQ